MKRTLTAPALIRALGFIAARQLEAHLLESRRLVPPPAPEVPVEAQPPAPPRRGGRRRVKGGRA